MIEIEDVERIIVAIPLRENISQIIPLTKGFSTDEKYVLTADLQPKYLLRISLAREAERRRQEFSLLTQLAEGGISCSKPYYFGELAEFGVCVSLLGYLAGESAEEALPESDTTVQYAIGKQAGKTLRRMHAALTAPNDVDWPANRERKYDRFLDITQERALRFTGQQLVEQYVDTHRQLMQERPATFLHDDYHPGNLIVSANQFVGVIDFNRCDWGDPYHDFYKVAHFSAPRFPTFACGQVDGYFGGSVPMDFWPIYTLYVAMSLHVDLAWTQRFWPDRLADSYLRIAEILKTHDFIEGTTLKWYRG